MATRIRLRQLSRYAAGGHLLLVADQFYLQVLRGSMVRLELEGCGDGQARASPVPGERLGLRQAVQKFRAWVRLPGGRCQGLGGITVAPEGAEDQSLAIADVIGNLAARILSRQGLDRRQRPLGLPLLRIDF